jgi:hypothetical protein
VAIITGKRYTLFDSAFFIPHPFAVGIPQVPSPHLWERVRVRGLNLAYSFFIPRSLAAG